MAADGPILVAEKVNPAQGWLVYRRELFPDLTGAL